MKKHSIVIVYLAAFFLSFAYGVFLILPLFIDHIGSNESITGKILALCGIGTLSAVWISKNLLRAVNGKWVAASGGLFYSLGAMGFWLANTISLPLLLGSLFLGIGWGLYYNAAPYILSVYAEEKSRSVLFSYLSAFNVLGTGSAPILIKFLWADNIDFSTLFIVAALCSFFSASLFCTLKIAFPKVPKENTSSLKKTVSLLFTTPTKYPLLMVCLGACAFTMLLNFQTTYADTIGMSYAYFYITYTLAVIVSRFALGRYLARFNQYKLSLFLLGLMVISLLLFPLSPMSLYVYIVNSALFGISYGLVYPALQAIAVNTTQDEYKAEALTFFSLLYFVGVYAFPPLGGFLIVHFGYHSLMVVIALLAIVELALGYFLYRLQFRACSQSIL